MSKATDLEEIARPGEEQSFIDWRKSNKRHITLDPCMRALNMLEASFRASIPEISGGTDRLISNIEKERDFLFFDEYQSWDEWRYKSMLAYSQVDPNCVILDTVFIF